jgi:hypothetical protein
MPDGRKEMELDIEILGKLDPSVMSTINQVKAALASMGADARTRNEVMKRAYSQMFDSVGRGAKTMEGQTKGVFRNIADMAGRAASHMKESFLGTFKEIGGEVAKGLGFGAGFAIPSMVGAGVERVKEFGAEAVDIRAEREALQTQMRTILESQGKMLLTPQIDTMLRNIEGREVPEKYADLLKATTLLFSSAPEKFTSVDQLHKMLTQLADISRTPEAFSLATQAFTRMIAEGKVDAAHLRELAVDTGYNFKLAMADALKVSPEELSDMIKKKTLTGEQSLDALFSAFDRITGPGGPAYHHAEAQLAGLKGLEARWTGHVEDFQESFGRQMENVMAPVMEEIFKHLTPAELTHAFDAWTPIMKGLGDSIAYVMESFTKGPTAAEIKGIGDAFNSLFGKILGTGGVPMFKKVLGGPGGMEEIEVLSPEFKARLDAISGSITKTLDSIRSTIQFVADHWQTIKDGMVVAAAAWGGKKIFDVAKGIRDLLQQVGLMNVQAGVVNVTGGLPGGKAVGEAEKVAGKLAPAAGEAGAGGALAAVGAAAAPALAVAGGAALGVNLIYRTLPKIPEAAKYDPEVLAEKRRIAAEAESRFEVMEAERKAGMGGTEGDYKAALAALTTARTQLAAEMKKAEAAKAALPPGAAAPPLPPIPMAPVPKAPPSLPPVPMAPPVPPVAALPDLTGKTTAISSSITSISDALAAAPGKASEASGHLDSVASIFAGLPGQASSISGSLNSLVAAINSAAASAAASIHSAAASAAANMMV